MKTEDIIAIKIRQGRSRCFNRVIKIAETTTITDIIFDDPLKERLIKNCRKDGLKALTTANQQLISTTLIN